MKENNQIELESLITDEQQLKNLNDFMQMSFVYESAMGIMRTKLDVLQKEYSLAHGYNPIHTIESRLKKPLSIVNKLRRKNLEISIDAVRRNLKDVAGMRIICNYKNDVYTIVEVLKRQLDVSVVEEKDYIKSPKENGYRSYHLCRYRARVFHQPRGNGAHRDTDTHHRHGFLGEPRTQTAL